MPFVLGENRSVETGMNYDLIVVGGGVTGSSLARLPTEVDRSVAYVGNDVSTGGVAALFPQRGDRARAYFGFSSAKMPTPLGRRRFRPVPADVHSNGWKGNPVR